MLDELKFLDKDIADEFRTSECAYIIGTPSLIQLSRDIKNLIEVIKHLKEFK